MSLAVVQNVPDHTGPGQIELCIARSRTELEDAFRLVHESYVSAGLDSANPLGLRVTRFHLQPMTQVMLAKQQGLPIATASLFFDDARSLPADAMYGEEIDDLRRRGLRLVEVGSFADRRESVSRFVKMLRRLTTLLAEVAKYSGCTAAIVTAHPKHARFYTRELGFEQFGESRACPYVKGKPAVALLLDFEKQKDTPAHEHLFGQKYTAEELAPFQWDSETRLYFTSIYHQIQQASGLPRSLPAVAPPSSATPLIDLAAPIGG